MLMSCRYAQTLPRGHPSSMPRRMIWRMRGRISSIALRVPHGSPGASGHPAQKGERHLWLGARHGAQELTNHPARTEAQPHLVPQIAIGRRPISSGSPSTISSFVSLSGAALGKRNLTSASVSTGFSSRVSSRSGRAPSYHLPRDPAAGDGLWSGASCSHMALLLPRACALRCALLRSAALRAVAESAHAVDLTTDQREPPQTGSVRGGLLLRIEQIFYSVNRMEGRRWQRTGLAGYRT